MEIFDFRAFDQFLVNDCENYGFSNAADGGVGDEHELHFTRFR